MDTRIGRGSSGRHAGHHICLRVLGGKSGRAAAAHLPIRCQRLARPGGIPGRLCYRDARIVASLFHRDVDVFDVLRRRTAVDNPSRETAALWGCVRAAALRDHELRCCPALGRAGRRIGGSALGRAQYFCPHVLDRRSYRNLYKPRLPGEEGIARGEGK